MKFADLVAQYLPEQATPGELPRDLADWPPECLEEFEERAAIMEFDGGLSRAAAERAAEACVREAFRRAHKEEPNHTQVVDKIIQ